MHTKWRRQNYVTVCHKKWRQLKNLEEMHIEIAINFARFFPIFNFLAQQKPPPNNLQLVWAGGRKKLKYFIVVVVKNEKRRILIIVNTFVWNNNKPRENIPRVCSNAAIKRSVSTIYRRISIVFCFLSFVFGFGFLHRLESLKRISGIVRVYMRKSSVLDYCFRDVVVCVSVLLFFFPPHI